MHGGILQTPPMINDTNTASPNDSSGSFSNSPMSPMSGKERNSFWSPMSVGSNSNSPSEVYEVCGRKTPQEMPGSTTWGKEGLNIGRISRMRVTTIEDVEDVEDGGEEQETSREQSP
jgi:hypothetical protein